MASAAKPWVTLSVVLLVALITRIALCDSVTRENIHSRPSEKSGLQVSGGPGMLVQSDATGFQFGLAAYYPISTSLPLYVGLETGLDVVNYGSNVSSSASMSSLGVPLLGTVLYRFEKSGGKVPVQPSIGMSVGPNIYFMKYGGGRASRTVAYFEMLFRGGVSFELSPDFSLNVEPKIGIVGSSAIFISQASLLLNI